MSAQQVKSIGGINLYVDPLNRDASEMIKAVNVTSDFYGAKKKRPGYSTFLGTTTGSIVNSLFSYYQNDGSTFFLYKVSGNLIEYSAQGTGAWTVAGNGTISAGSAVGYAVLDNTLIVGDGAGSTRHTTSGTSFTNTTAAPIASQFEQYQNRIYAMGTSSSMFYSTSGSATDWSLTPPSDSSSFIVPGAGKLSSCFKCNDRLVITKAGGEMYRWDGYSLTEMATKAGPSSPYSYDKAEGYYFWLNRLGIFGYGGGRPELLSNPIERQIYNASGSAIVGTVFNNAPAAVHKYDYFVSVGSVTDDYTKETISNCVIKYDFNKNEFLNWSLAVKPTCFHSYKDANGVQQLIFGAAGGQVYKFADTDTSDNSTAISTSMMFCVDGGTPEADKRWDWLFLFFNPGCQAVVQIACTDNLTPYMLNWIDVGDVSQGITRFKFPNGCRSKLLYIKINESSSTTPFVFYGYSYEAQPIPL